MELDDQAAAVTDHVTLAAFLEGLAENYDRRPDEWENGSLSQFLDALARFVGSMDSWAANNRVDLPDDPKVWSMFAKLMLIAREYE